MPFFRRTRKSEEKRKLPGTSALANRREEAATSVSQSKAIAFAPILPPKIKSLPPIAPLPEWVQSLKDLQVASFYLTVGIGSLAVFIYAYTVRSQMVWWREYDRLRRLQDREQQQMLADAQLKSQLAKEALKPGSKLVDPSPDNIIFVPQASQRRPTHPTLSPHLSLEPTIGPIGY